MSETNDISVLYSKVNKLDTRMAKIESTRPYLQEMIERNIASNEKLAETMESVQLSMVKMNEKMDTQSHTIEEMKREFAEANEKTNQRISEIDLKVDEIDDKGQFDIWVFLKQNLPWIIALLGMGMLYAAQFFKFWLKDERIKGMKENLEQFAPVKSNVYDIEVKRYLSLAEIQTIVNGTITFTTWAEREQKIDMMLLLLATNIGEEAIQEKGHDYFLNTGIIKYVKEQVENFDKIAEAIKWTESTERSLAQILKVLNAEFKKIGKNGNKK